MQTAAELRHQAKVAPVEFGKLRHSFLDREKASKTKGVPFGVAGKWPGDDHLVADISMHLPIIIGNRPIDIEEEAGSRYRGREVRPTARQGRSSRRDRET